MRFFPIAFATNSAGFPGVMFVRLSGSLGIWRTECARDRQIDRQTDRGERKKVVCLLVKTSAANVSECVQHGLLQFVKGQTWEHPFLTPYS